ncbi:MAG: helix-turn-helix domain-containing protein [Acidimicrobiales bacterium]
MSETNGPRAKGREAVEAALIEAASDLLADLGPRATTVRDIAARAGVNHAQVHHYFGSKRALLRAAMSHMATKHHQAVLALAGGRPVPPPLAVPVDDQRYWRAAVRATIEGDIELAGVEVTDGVSVSRTVLENLTRHFGLEEPNIDLKVQLAQGTATQLGWLALEPFLFLVAGVTDEEQEEVRQRVRHSIASGRFAVNTAEETQRWGEQLHQVQQATPVQQPQDRSEP